LDKKNDFKEYDKKVDFYVTQLFLNHILFIFFLHFFHYQSFGNINMHYDRMKAQQHSSTTASSGTDLNALGWRRLLLETLKCNVDAACYAEQNKFCIAACVRDEHGSFVKGMAQCFNGTPVMQEAEAIGILEAMKWLHSINISY
jgi:hypothetical protein